MSSPSDDAAFHDVEKGGAAPLGVDLPPEPPEARILKPIPDTTPMERVAGAFAAAAVITSLAAIIIEHSFLVIVAGVLSSFVGPYAYFQQTQLTEIAALKETQMAVQNEVNRLKNENNRLEANIGKMGDSVERLKDVKTALDTITSTQGKTIADFELQVEKNRQNLKMMQANVKDVVVQNLFSIVERIDADRDKQIEAHEVEEALEQLQKLDGVTVDPVKFRKTFNGLPSESMLHVLQNIMKEDLKPEERIFQFVEQ